MTTAEQIKAVSKIADDVSGSVYEGYSGRGMFGALCYGIVCKKKNAVIKLAHSRGLSRPSIDDLGRDCICYWPELEWSDEVEATP